MAFNIDHQGKTQKTSSVRYVLHRDIAESKWNVFKRVGLFEEFVQGFDELSDAQDFCDINNGVAEALDGKQ